MSEGPYSSLNLATHVKDDERSVVQNRRLFLDALSLGDFSSRLVVPHQAHGDTVMQVSGDFDRNDVSIEHEADAVVCDGFDIPVMLCFADCAPVMVVAPSGAFAVIHAGWRGALAGIVGKAVDELARVSSCDPSGFNVYIGPHIGPCCYEVPQKRIDAFVDAYGPSCDAGDRHLSLSAAIRADVQSHGVVASRIAQADSCTAESVGEFFSFRAENGLCGRHGALACRIKG
ncbi:MAG: laccase domain-containing protein [Actinobacteria bacterium]|nr:laccase domain-containing protein [Actinomycetota bacterium]